MNKDRRKNIEALNERLRKAMEELDEIRSELEDVQAEEQEYLDNMPESLKSGDKGSAAEEAVNELQTVIDGIESFIGESFDANLDNACA